MMETFEIDGEKLMCCETCDFFVFPRRDAVAMALDG